MGKRKIGIIASAIMVCVVCISLIAGSTLALFTANSSVDITVSSANVAVEASIANVGTDTEDSALINGANTDLVAGVVGGKLVVTNMLPGDIVTADLAIANSSTVAIKYRVSMNVTGDEAIADNLVLSIADVKYASEVTPWTDVAVGTDKITLPVSVLLPASVGNVAQAANVTVALTVEAVQGNAVTSDDDVVVLEEVATAEAMSAAIANGGAVRLMDDVQLTEAINVVGEKDVVLNLNGNKITATANAFNLSDSVNMAVNNGSIVSGGRAFNMLDDSSLNLENVNINSALGIVSCSTGTIDIVGGEIETSQQSIYLVPNNLAYNYDGNEPYRMTLNVKDTVVKTHGNVGFWLSVTDAVLDNVTATVDNASESSTCVFPLGGTVITLNNCNLTCVNGSGLQGQGNVIGATGTVGENATVTLNNCDVVGGLCALYLPQARSLTTVNGGTYKASVKSAIEIRAGELILNNATVTGTAENFEVKPTPKNGGSTVYGAALAISRYDTGDVKVTINGGTYEAVYALYETGKMSSSTEPKTTTIAMDNSPVLKGYVHSDNCDNIENVEPEA